MAKSKQAPTTSDTTTTTQATDFSQVFPDNQASTDSAATVTSTPEPEQTNQPSAVSSASPPAPESGTTQPDSGVGGGWLDSVRQYGFEDVKDEDDAKQRVLQAWQQQQERASEYERRMKELEPLVGLGQQYWEQQQRERQQQQQAQQPAPQQEQPQSLWPSFPKLDPQVVQRWREQDSTGEWKWKFGTPMEIQQAAVDFKSQADKWTNDLIYRPKEALEPPIRAITREEVMTVLKEQFGMEPKELVSKLDISGERAYVDRILTEYQDYLFDKDPRSGRLDYNRASAIGNMFFQAVEESKQMGITSEANQYYNALRLIQPYLQQQTQTTATATAQVTAEQKRNEHLRRGAARSAPSRDGSVPKTNAEPGEVQNKGQSFGSSLAQELVKAGFVR